MAATTINTSGIVLTNDTGTASAPNGDGTVLNAALWALLLTRINECFSGAFTIGGLFAAEGFGTHAFSAGGTGANQVNVRNTTAGAGNLAQINLGNDATAYLATLAAFSSTYTTAGAAFQAGTLLQAYGAGGLSIASNHASGTVRVYTNGNALRSTWGVDGTLSHASGLSLSGVANRTITGTESWLTGIGGAFLVRVTSATASPALIGIYAPAAGETHLITNVSGAAFTIVNESGSVGDPTFRFACPGNSNVGVDDGDSVLVHYSASDSRWIVAGI